ncbi:hypothetical protein LCI18_006862 [Fusarium solani-melongenae]|uniref:Uncharacterized protein n=1 Tax=Fusarium solani subsp. cucurbitae TaxID=2747967 RepID=A0ACD3Z3Z2_FUSSC|nr:hypothetical protein LCI18_006862 [Fusarium solani-melongenae]
MCVAINLLKEGIRDFVILEKSTGFGGTWKDNAYPGCCCDILSRLYCYSFEQNPNWSRLFPEQGEILNYIRDVARKYDLYRYVRFSSEVTEATWEPLSQQWRVLVRVLAGKEAEACDNYTIKAGFVAAGLGQLSEPYRPEIAGEAAFRGKIMHSARWDWSCDLSGKRVGIIGNGATSVQIVPEVAKVASHLTIFQRSPNWVIPRMNEDVPGWKRTLLQKVPFLLNRLRAEAMDSREAYFQALIQRESADFMQSQLPDRPDLWETLTPDYPPGCKRILLSDDYYPALRLPNVRLETRRIQRITKDGIVTGKDGGAEEAIELDVIIFATGFSTQNFMHGIKVQGLGGTPLDEIWAKGASALYGVTVESLPNFGMLYGPNTNLGHNSIVLMIEAQTRYILSLVKETFKARQRGRSISFTPRPERVKEWNQELHRALASSSFADPRCQSWYKTEDGLYQKTLSRIDWSDYEIKGDAETLQVLKGESYIGRVVEETIVGARTLIAGAVFSAVAAGGLLLQARGRLALR